MDQILEFVLQRADEVYPSLRTYVNARPDIISLEALSQAVYATHSNPQPILDWISQVAAQYSPPGHIYPGAPNVPEFVPTVPAGPAVGLPSQAMMPQVAYIPPPPAPFNPAAPRQARPTRIPKAWQARVRSRGRVHEVYIDQRVIATTPRRSGAHKLRKAWNSLIAELGAARQFQIRDVINILRDELVNASYDRGAANGFDPPLLGVGGRDRPRFTLAGPIPDMSQAPSVPYGAEDGFIGGEPDTDDFNGGGY